jgi:dihydrofolate synthase/folylpolyglutamate synthase
VTTEFLGQGFGLPALGLLGEHQTENAEVAILLSYTLRDNFRISDDALVAGLENARHPGRLEYQGRFLFDGAHNIAGAKALREYLDEFEHRPVTMIFAAMKDKDVREIGEILFPRAERLVLTKPENSRALDPDEILRRIPDLIDIDKILLTKKVVDAIKRANEVTAEDGLILITGSLYLVGEAKRILSSQI